jgi:hypothetical protein
MASIGGAVVRIPIRGKEPAQIRALAAQLFIQAFPRLLADEVRRAHPLASAQFYFLGSNAAALAPGLADDDARVVMASAWLDLADQPVVLRLPATFGRHLALTLFDPAGRPFASIGSRTGHDGDVDIAIVGPNWRGELPSGLSARRAPADSAWVVSRLYAHSSLDHATTVAIAKRQCVAHLATDSPSSSTALPFLSPPSMPTVREVVGLTPELMLHRIQAIIDRTSTPDVEPIRRLVTELMVPLETPAGEHVWPGEFAGLIGRGIADGMEAIRAADALSAEGAVGAWRAAASNASVWPTAALELAARAFAALGAPEREDTLTFSCQHDSQGEPLSGACSYAMHFPRSGLPPVEAFWWLSAQPAAAAIGRQGVGDRNDLVLNRDGSLDILIQSAPPAPSRIPNWLPAPDGHFSLSIRLHWPRTPALSGHWRMPPVERTDSGVTANGPSSRRGARQPMSPINGPPRRHREMSLIWRCV